MFYDVEKADSDKNLKICLMCFDYCSGSGSPKNLIVLNDESMKLQDCSESISGSGWIVTFGALDLVLG